MKTIAKVTLLGIVGRDPEVKQAKNGMYLATFPLATNVLKKDPNGNKFEGTLWHNLIAFDKSAELVQKMVTKGSKLYVEGAIDYQEWLKDGEKRLSTKIIINDFSVIGKTDPQQRPTTMSERNRQEAPGFMDDDIPF